MIECQILLYTNESLHNPHINYKCLGPVHNRKTRDVCHLLHPTSVSLTRRVNVNAPGRKLMGEAFNHEVTPYFAGSNIVTMAEYPTSEGEVAFEVPNAGKP